MRASRKFGIAMLLILSASQVLAEEALYCVDTAAVGFMWDRKGEAKPTEFSCPPRTPSIRFHPLADERAQVRVGSPSLVRPGSN